MSVIQKAVDEYLSLRRSLGFKLRDHQYVLRDFVSYFEKKRLPYITNREVLHWAKLPANASPRYWASRISRVRGFAQHWSATDTRTEIPPPGLIPYHYVRSAPYIYKDEQVAQLIKAAKHLPSKTGLRQWTYSTLFGLIAVAGLRISEAVDLKSEDVDLTQGVITIRQTKFGKTRLVPVHSSTQRALQKYVRHRESILSKLKTDNFFVSEKGTRLTGCAVRWIFISLSRQIGLRGKCDSHGPRIHDLRHTFAVKLLMEWYRTGLNVEQRMPKLSTYLGHAHITDTYWYLSATPELLRLASNRLEHLEKRKLS